MTRSRLPFWTTLLTGLALTVACLAYHLLNGIRHLVWDTGRALDLRSAYTGGWLVLIGTVLLTAVVLGVLS